MKITKEWLQSKSACNSGVEWFLSQKETDGVKIVEKLIAEKQFDWASWTIVRLMTQEQRVMYAIYAAEQVIDIFERKYPDNQKPREAIEAAKECLKNPTDSNKKKADDAADAAYAAVYAAYAAYAAAYAAYAAADAAASAAAHAASAADARREILIKILTYGMELMK